MRKLVLGSALGLAACSSPEPTPAAVEDKPAVSAGVEADDTAPASTSIDAAKAALLAEPTVKDIRYNASDAVQWHVGVIDDGSSRVGFAEYVCLILMDKGALSGLTHVRVVDVAEVAAGTDVRDASLGHVICETGDVVAP